MDTTTTEKSQENTDKLRNFQRSDSVSNLDRGKYRQKKILSQSQSDRNVTFTAKSHQQNGSHNSKLVGLPEIGDGTLHNRRANAKSSWDRQRSYTESSLDMLAARKKAKARSQKRESIKLNASDDQDDEFSDGDNQTGLREKRQVLIHGLSYYKYRMVVDWLRQSRMPARIVLPVI